MNRDTHLRLGVTFLILLLSGCASNTSSPSRQGALEPSPPGKTAPSEPSITIDPKKPHAYYAMCGGRLTDLQDLLEPIADSMVSQKIPYSQAAANEWRDCSGNFLRLSSYLAEECPELENSLAATRGVTDFEPGADNVVAGAKAVSRTTRGIAKWYSSQGRFAPVYYDGAANEKTALEKYRDLIRPGSVLWFSRSKPASSMGVDPLFNRQINHMGTVVSVTRNESGEVVGYQMYHGRNKGKVATVTSTHFWDWPEEYLGSGRSYPPLGYWGQYLVGIGTIAPVQTF